jgi:hypothetical protein
VSERLANILIGLFERLHSEDSDEGENEDDGNDEDNNESAQ